MACDVICRCWSERCWILLGSFQTEKWVYVSGFKMSKLKARDLLWTYTTCKTSQTISLSQDSLYFNICCHGRLQASEHPKFNLALVKVKLSFEGSLKDSLFWKNLFCLEKNGNEWEIVEHSLINVVVGLLFIFFCNEWYGASAWCHLSTSLKKEPLK